MYVHIHFNHVTKARSLSMTIDIKDRYLFLPTCYNIKPQRTERSPPTLSVHNHIMTMITSGRSHFVSTEAICEVVTTAPYDIPLVLSKPFYWFSYDMRTSKIDLDRPFDNNLPSGFLASFLTICSKYLLWFVDVIYLPDVYIRT